jgi:hypothetical protein
MKIECSWCRKDLGCREPLQKGGITHGICSRCLQMRVYPFIKHSRLMQPRPAPPSSRRLRLEK